MSIYQFKVCEFYDSAVINVFIPELKTIWIKVWSCISLTCHHLNPLEHFLLRMNVTVNFVEGIYGKGGV